MFATCTGVPDKAKAPHAYRWYIHIAAIKGVRRCEVEREWAWGKRSASLRRDPLPSSLSLSMLCFPCAANSCLPQL